MKKSLLTIALAGLSAVAVQADLFGFDTVTTNSSYRGAVASQLFMETTELATGLSSVMFTNIGPLASTVTEVYFGSDEALDLNLDSIIFQCPGVDFDITGAKPANPPGMNDFGNWWTITIAAAEASNPPAQKGIDPLECINLQVSYSGSSSLSELIQFNQLQVALHVTGLPDFQSDTFVNGNDPYTVIPEPSSIILLGVAGILGFFVRRRFSV